MDVARKIKMYALPETFERRAVAEWIISKASFPGTIE